MGLVLLLVALLAGAVAASPARAADEGCAAFAWPVARERQAFSGTLPTIATGGVYALGTAVSVTLAPQGEVAYTLKPRRAPHAAPAYGAEMTAQVDKAGTYQATLSAEAWIDLAQGKGPLRPSAFSGKRDCPGLRKSVRFRLEPGPVTIAVSDAAAPAVMLDILPAE